MMAAVIIAGIVSSLSWSASDYHQLEPLPPLKDPMQLVRQQAAWRDFEKNLYNALKASQQLRYAGGTSRQRLLNALNASWKHVIESIKQFIGSENANTIPKLLQNKKLSDKYTWDLVTDPYKFERNAYEAFELAYIKGKGYSDHIHDTPDAYLTPLDNPKDKISENVQQRHTNLVERHQQKKTQKKQ